MKRAIKVSPRTRIALALFCSFLAVASVCARAAYQSHGNDQDVDRFLSAYPAAKGTSLDDCFLCHPGGLVEGKAKGSCDYCHASYGYHAPHGPLPLNQFAKDYLAAGRSAEAFRAIANLDSDKDGYSNVEEIAQLTGPGEAGDHPGLVQAPAVTLSVEQLRKLPITEQFMLMNTTKSGDFYVTYRGVALWDLLQAVGLASGATSVSVFSPDGFSTDFSLEDVARAYPGGVFYADLPWVSYPPNPSYQDQQAIPGPLKLLLAYERDGAPLGPGRLAWSGEKWALDGEGPYRVVIPQRVPSPPDRSSTAPDKNDQPYPYDEKADHNAGFSVRSVVAIRVNPLPAGVKDFNWREGGWNLVDAENIVVYGAIKR